MSESSDSSWEAFARAPNRLPGRVPGMANLGDEGFLKSIADSRSQSTSAYLCAKRSIPGKGVDLNKGGVQRREMRPHGRVACFVAAPQFVDISPVLDMLVRMDIEPILPSPTPVTASSFAESVPRTIRNADFALGLVSASSSNSNVFYEIGAAIALGKRTLLVVEPGTLEIPSDIQDLLQVRANFSDGAPIQYALSQLLVTIHEPTWVPMGSVARTRPLGKRTDGLLRQLRDLESTGSEVELGKLVVGALEESGVTASASPKETPYGTDFAVWADELNAWVGNPLLVEVKRSLISGDELQSLARQLDVALSESNARWVLLLYANKVGSETLRRGLGPRRILLMSVRELLEKLRDRSFGDIIREARNRVMHGRDSD